MYLIAPDILAEARGLSAGVSGTGVALGLLLWLFGWRWHRFWTVLGVTVAGGLYGLSAGQAGGGHIIAMGLLLAVSAGLLALELARLFAFGAGGTAAWLAAGALFPDAQGLGVFFLVGGLAGILFYRLWTMTFTSFLGTMLAGHAGLVLLETLTRFDAADWAGRNPVGLGIAVGLLTALGLAAQGAQVRWTSSREKKKGKESDKAEKSKGRKAAKGEPEPDEVDGLPPDVQALRDLFRKRAG